MPKDPRRLRDERGFTLIDILFVVGLIGVLCSMAIPGLTRARGAAQASSALGTLRVINSAQLSFAITCGLGFYSPDLQTLGVKPPSATDAFLSPELSSAATVVKSGYSFTTSGTPLAGAPASCNGLGAGQTAPGYFATADPLDTQQMPRFFGTNADGAIYEDVNSYGGSMPQTGAPAAGSAIK